MSKLHQLLAVHDSAQTMFKKVNEEAISTFTKKQNLFEGMSSSTTSKLDAQDPLYPKFPDSTQYVPVAEDVESKLNYVFNEAVKYFDINYQIDAANCYAKADLILEGNTVATDVPATSLLFLENKFKSVRGVIEAVPTLDPAIQWTKDGAVYRMPEAVKPVVEVVPEHTQVSPPTDKHPAQIAVVQKTYIRGITKITGLSGRITSARKSELLGKCDKIINACKQARQRANDVDHPTAVIGQKIFDYLIK